MQEVLVNNYSIIRVMTLLVGVYVIILFINSPSKHYELNIETLLQDVSHVYRGL